MEETNSDRMTGVVRTLQIIILALAGGVFMFALVAFYLPRGGGELGNAVAVVSLLMVAMSLVMILARVLVPGMIERTGCQKIAQEMRQSSAGQNAGQPWPDAGDEKLLAVFDMSGLR